MAADRSDSTPTRVLFVCLGNICRSPLAEGVFASLADEAGLSERFDVDSAGTGDWHVGEKADPRSAAVARRHGVELTCRARQVTAKDLHDFDHVIAMDQDNLRNLQRMAASSGGDASIELLREYDPDPGDGDVPDPYSGGDSGFDDVYDIVRRSCVALLAHLTADGVR
jgi:protein-tyrosine phosphatase